MYLSDICTSLVSILATENYKNLQFLFNSKTEGCNKTLTIFSFFKSEPKSKLATKNLNFLVKEVSFRCN